MAAKDLGTKHACFKCGTKFYDMKKPAPICPKCGANQNDAPKSPPAEKRVRAAPKAVAPVDPEVEVEAVDDDELEDDADDDEASEDEP
jgi:uncharacterized protein (TIGR02300 family)